MRKLTLAIPAALVATITLTAAPALRSDAHTPADRIVAASAIPDSTRAGLAGQRRKETAMMLVSTAENSSLDWRDQYGYIEYNVEGNWANRGYTGGIIGFTSKTHDMLELVRMYAQRRPDAPLSGYVGALERVDGTASTEGLGDGFVWAWRKAAEDQTFRDCQDSLRDKMYFTPAVTAAKADGLGPLGQFVYYDAAVMHGTEGMNEIRKAAAHRATDPARGGSERAYLEAFLDVRRGEMESESHSDYSRIDDTQRRFVREGNYGLSLPLTWNMYGEEFTLTSEKLDSYLRDGNL